MTDDLDLVAMESTARSADDCGVVLTMDPRAVLALIAENRALKEKADTAAHYAAQVVEMEARLARMREALAAVEALIADSDGVAGLHKNGDLALWDELRTGGEFEDWLRKFDEALSTEGDAGGWRPMSFQDRVAPWMQACFGPEISADVTERNHRFLEEALELVQAKGCTRDEAHQLVDYVFGRAIGDPHQEAGGAMVTLAALCLAADLDMHRAGEDELARISAPATMEKIRSKQAAKPKHSPLPALPTPPEKEADNG